MGKYWLKATSPENSSEHSNFILKPQKKKKKAGRFEFHSNQVIFSFTRLCENISFTGRTPAPDPSPPRSPEQNTHVASLFTDVNSDATENIYSGRWIVTENIWSAGCQKQMWTCGGDEDEAIKNSTDLHEHKTIIQLITSRKTYNRFNHVFKNLYRKNSSLSNCKTLNPLVDKQDVAVLMWFFSSIDTRKE